MGLKRKVSEWWELRREFANSRPYEEKASRLQTLCLLTGPYRNLTTLTSSLVALHPACQVLNHGSVRILPMKQTNIFEEFQPAKVQNLARYAIYLSSGGERGQKGGSITKSHAFAEHGKMREVYERRFGEETIKPEIHSLLWKESNRISNALRDSDFPFAEAFAAEKRLRFLMPIRHPMDCAKSNIKTGHCKHLVGKKDAEFGEVLEAVIGEIAWFLDLAEKFPERFFYFYEHTFDEEVLKSFAAFMKVEAEERWLADCMEVYDLKPNYEYPEEQQEMYRRLVNEKIARHEKARDALLKFVEPA